MNDLKMESSGKYQISIQGFLNADWSDRLGGLRIVTVESAEGQAMTILTGMIVDQAALLGVLNTLYDMRYPLLSVKRLALTPRLARRPSP
jgi:hypothetical protein